MTRKVISQALPVTLLLWQSGCASGFVSPQITSQGASVAAITPNDNVLSRLNSAIPTDVDKLDIIDIEPSLLRDNAAVTRARARTTIHAKHTTRNAGIWKQQQDNNAMASVMTGIRSGSDMVKTQLDTMVTQSGLRHMFDFSSAIPLNRAMNQPASQAQPDPWSGRGTLPCGQRQLPLVERYAKVRNNMFQTCLLHDDALKNRLPPSKKKISIFPI
jgi:hypothetical protein